MELLELLQLLLFLLGAHLGVEEDLLQQVEHGSLQLRHFLRLVYFARNPLAKRDGERVLPCLQPLADQ